jgi:CubicO group peptidase (beta-lactamase class C family)
MQDFSSTISRRALLRGSALLGAGFAGSVALPRWVYASAAAEAQFPNVARLASDYVGAGKLANVVAALGFGSSAPLEVSRGNLALDIARPADLDSLYRIYSMTKPVTGMAAMMLIDEGKLRLDQPIADLMPKYGKMQVQVTPDGSITELKPAQTQITVRHLLTHTAGLGYSIIQKGPLKEAFEKAGLVPGQVSRLPVPGLPLEKTLPSLALFADKLAEMPLVYEPGTRWSYSVGLDLLGRVIEIVSGKAFDAFLQERIFGPCAMTSTGFRVPTSQADRLTSNYGVFNGALVPIDPGASSIYLDAPAFPFGGAGLVCSPRDFDRFQMMLLGLGKLASGRVMSEAAVRLGTSNLLPPGADTTKTWAANAGFGAGGRVGLGTDAGTYGWSGAAGTTAFVNLRVGVRAGFYTQYMPSNSYPLSEEFTKALLADVQMKKAA